MIKLSSVLLVDDDPLTNDLNERLLRQLSVADQYLSANDGREALTALEHLAADAHPTSPVLVLLDVKMPGMNGMDFVEAYQQLPEDQQQAVVIVMHTASMSSVDLGRIESLPIAGLVSKPLTKEKLDTILQLHFQRRFSAE
ncbi:Response regulator receiver domain-containing protein [Hymenobacter gelipurpurascens]|uniref:Response regulator receiver domain-containing protein n=1 Tax=Hymenobacter gelipurpurascens TaxID=89968 RepID=A0A212UHH7_9BACT|nr:response regulator [Hymenobacter gelipurpurascens]SNC77692.1 Response regulator receiver domain-containing protein [Hymenobacter gelipurpurascens]